MEDRFSPIPAAKQELLIQKKIANTAIHFLDENYADEVAGNEHVGNLKARYSSSLQYYISSYENGITVDDNNPMKRFQQVAIKLLDNQRELLYQMNRRSEFDEDLIRKYLSLLDLEETKLREKLPQDAQVD